MTSADPRATAAAASKCAWLGGLPPSLTERIVVLSPAEVRPGVVRPAHQVSVPARGRRLRVAVVGAGLAGLTAARILEEQGHDVVVVEKARGAGGRSATRRHEAWQFDHGAQYFTARDPRFLQHVLAWQERGSIALWEGRIGVVEKGRVQAAAEQTRRFVGLPGMNAVCRDIAGELSDCRFQWRVQSAALEHPGGASPGHDHAAGAGRTAARFVRVARAGAPGPETSDDAALLGADGRFR
jgi:glycine/D-amino acid oxidase-like deaminating enzyme